MDYAGVCLYLWQEGGNSYELGTCVQGSIVYWSDVLLSVPVGSIVNWWEDNHGEWEQEESSTSRGSAVASVLAEYVTAVSRIPLEVQRPVGGESNWQGDTEPGRGEARPARIRRIPARTSQSITESTILHTNGMSDSVGVYLSACGHAVHQECLDRYFSSLLQRYFGWVGFASG